MCWNIGSWQVAVPVGDVTASRSIGFLASIRLRVIRSIKFQVATCAKLKLLNGSLMNI